MTSAPRKTKKSEPDVPKGEEGTEDAAISEEAAAKAPKPTDDDQALTGARSSIFDGPTTADLNPAYNDVEKTDDK